MKKRIALLLAVSSLLTLGACGKKEEPAETTEMIPVLTESVLTEATETEAAPTEAFTEAPMETETMPPETIPVESHPAYEMEEGFVEQKDTVYAKRDVNVREKATVQSRKVGTLDKGDSVSRVGMSKDKKWSAVIYKDELRYIASEYLTTIRPSDTGSGSNGKVFETPASGVFYTIKSTNMYKGPGADTAFMMTIPGGSQVTRTATCDNGWFKISYNGMVGYVAGGSVTTEAPTEPTKPSTKPEEGTEGTDPTVPSTKPDEPAETTEPSVTPPETSAPTIPDTKPPVTPETDPPTVPENQENA